MTMILSTELSAIAADFIARRTAITSEELNETGRLLSALAQLAFSQERELEIHRLREEGKAATQIIGQLVGDRSAEILGILEKADGNIVRPDFSKGSKS